MTNPAPPVPTPPGMAWIPGGSFLMGSDRHYPEEAPAHPATVAGFWMDIHPVTNRDFGRFVKATGYVTRAERPADPALYPGARPEMLVPASTVFHSPKPPVDLGNHLQWWSYIPGADWRHPRGPQSSIRKMSDHPVVHIAFKDAAAYAAWAGREIATEAEWEFAARGGLDGAEFVWGDEFTPGGKHLANTWQGDFPCHNSREDGFEFTSPVGSYPPNGYGLYDMAGNVWQWTSDPYKAHGEAPRSCCSGAQAREATADPASTIAVKVTKGGSHLCAPEYCRRYRPAARMPQPADTSISHLGFRCILRPGSPVSPR